MGKYYSLNGAYMIAVVKNNKNELMIDKKNLLLNGICPYYTMFPLDFPLKHLSGVKEGTVFDPFCGRGTTAFAARFLGLPSVGIDINPVAVAIARSKLVNVSPDAIVDMAKLILSSVKPDRKPRGKFWELAYHPDTMNDILKFRAGLRGKKGPLTSALIGIILGALHGPVAKTKDSYFSNQMQRTFAPKPDYAIRYWTERNLLPRKVDTLTVIQERSERYYSNVVNTPKARIFLGDSRKLPIVNSSLFSVTITSPPYYGMNTYVPDQWLRSWFLGGDDQPIYKNNRQISEGSIDTFITNLSKVWGITANKSIHGAKLVIRFGALKNRYSNPEEIIKSSLKRSNAPWRVSSITSAGNSERGYRQAIQMGAKVNKYNSIEEIDVICYLNN
jgi:hypothetical protein